MSDERLDGIDTRWSLVRQAHATGETTSAAQARSILVMRYASAVRRYIGGILKDPDNTDDIAQEAIVRLLQGDFAGADPARGRFRDLLKTAVRNMIKNYWAKQNRRKPADADLNQFADSTDDRDKEWQAAWQKTVLDHALQTMLRGEKTDAGRAAAAVFKLRTEFPNATSEELAAKLSEQLGSVVRADTARQWLRRARLKFAECLIEELRKGLDDETPTRVLEELADLELLEHVRDFLPADYAQTGTLA
jgi:RNA polymerase sigma factor (sigma-70 family)